ncbi:MAG: hypothetical protein M1823_002783 [Watsoniomyces obsoletus]|nr:MAG: hypothetical protein M1823_002783 [Watsoniomyces obsoletus]
MDSFLFSRALGDITPAVFEQLQATRLIHALQPAAGSRAIIFDASRYDSRPMDEDQGAASSGSTSRLKQSLNEENVDDDGLDDLFEEREDQAHAAVKVSDRRRGTGAPNRRNIQARTTSAGHNTSAEERSVEKKAHPAGVNALVVDPFEGRLASTSTKSKGHRFGITHLSFYAFDNNAYLSSSYDHTLKLSPTETNAPSASFDLDSMIYSHAMSPIADHLLVACATQFSMVRLVDLRSGASTHSLAGHVGSVLSVAWSPRDEHVLASGGEDGNVRLWDVRRSGGPFAILDVEHVEGMSEQERTMLSTRRQQRTHQTHDGPVNGLIWAESGDYIITTGHDDQVRVWNSVTTANTLASFGPLIRNRQLSTNTPVLAPSRFLPPEQQIMFYPNKNEILVFDLFEGTLLKRLKTVVSGEQNRTMQSRITSLTWRVGNVEMYSGHTDGLIRAWMPRTQEEAALEEEEEREANIEDEDKMRKRRVLNDIYKDLTSKKITFGLS